MGYNLIITEKADEHIDSLVGYLLGKLKNPQAAGNFLNEIDGIYDWLEDNPYQFPIIWHFRNTAKPISRKCPTK